MLLALVGFLTNMLSAPSSQFMNKYLVDVQGFSNSFIVVFRFATTALPDHPLLSAAHTLTAGIGLAIAIGAPLLAAAVVLEIAFALVARAASPAQVQALLAPIRALALLAIVAVVLERVAGVVALAVRGS